MTDFSMTLLDDSGKAVSRKRLKKSYNENRKSRAKPLLEPKLSDIEGITQFYREYAHAIVDGKRVRIPKELALRYAKEKGVDLLPKGCTGIRKNIEDGKVRRILFNYAITSLVQLVGGAKVYIPREQADRVQATLDGVSFLERKVDQPWNDRSLVLDAIDFRSILWVVRAGKKTVRVFTEDFIEVLISRKVYDAYLTWKEDKTWEKEILATMGYTIADEGQEAQDEALGFSSRKVESAARKMKSLMNGFRARASGALPANILEADDSDLPPEMRAAVQQMREQLKVFKSIMDSREAGGVSNVDR
jgi:hypothetical protein